MRFCILSIKRDDSICPELAFSDDDLYMRLGDLEPEEVVGISVIHPQSKATKWVAVGVYAVWLFKSDDGETRNISYEFDTGGRNGWPKGKGAWSLLWRRT